MKMGMPVFTMKIGVRLEGNFIKRSRKSRRKKSQEIEEYEGSF